MYILLIYILIVMLIVLVIWNVFMFKRIEKRIVEIQEMINKRG